ncbi:unnamed protein product, partial [Cladocopium goreaui]
MPGFGLAFLLSRLGDGARGASALAKRATAVRLPLRPRQTSIVATRAAKEPPTQAGSKRSLATLALVAGAFRSTKRREQRLRRIGSSRVALGGMMRMISPDEALPGRETELPISSTHAVLGTPMKGTGGDYAFAVDRNGFHWKCVNRLQIQGDPGHHENWACIPLACYNEEGNIASGFKFDEDCKRPWLVGNDDGAVVADAPQNAEEYPPIELLKRPLRPDEMTMPSWLGL